MLGLLADVNSEGHLAALRAVGESAAWRVVWEGLGVAVLHFEALGLRREMPDSELWHFCQTRGVLLITANRNRRAADSLEATIAAHNDVRSLPVLTLADPDRVLRDREYAELVVSRLLEVLIDLDANRGTGRLWLP